MNEVQTYENEFINKIIMGVEPLGSLDKHVETIKSMGINEAIEIIVFIQCDSMDGRVMGCMDHPGMVRATPNIDSWPTFQTRLIDAGYLTKTFGKTDYLSGNHTPGRGPQISKGQTIDWASPKFMTMTTKK